MKLGLGLGINKGGFVSKSIFADATLAFSLRNLGLGAGEIVEVRRDSNNDFDRFTASQIDNGSVESFTNGLGLVTWWKEQNGSGNDAYQNTSTKQPIIVDSSGNLITENGKPSIKLNNDKELTFSSTNSILAFTVGKVNNINNVNYILGGIEQGYFYGGSLSSINGLGAFTKPDLLSITGENLEQKLGIFQHKNGNIHIQENNNGFIDKGALTSLKLDTIGGRQDVGVTSNFNGLIQEAIVYSNTVNTNNIQKDINDYYGIY